MLCTVITGLTQTLRRLLSLTDIKFGTIFGANVGFEFVGRQDFASIDHPASWAIMINLFAVRFTITRYPKDEE